MRQGVVRDGPATNLLRDAVHHDLVVHRRADVALRPQVLGAVVLRKNEHSVSMGKDSKKK